MRRLSTFTESRTNSANSLVNRFPRQSISNYIRCRFSVNLTAVILIRLLLNKTGDVDNFTWDSLANCRLHRKTPTITKQPGWTIQKIENKNSTKVLYWKRVQINILEFWSTAECTNIKLSGRTFYKLHIPTSRIKLDSAERSLNSETNTQLFFYQQ